MHYVPSSMITMIAIQNRFVRYKVLLTIIMLPTSSPGIGNLKHVGLQRNPLSYRPSRTRSHPKQVGSVAGVFHGLLDEREKFGSTDG